MAGKAFRALSEEHAGSIEQEAERAFAAILEEYDMYGVLANREKINILQEPVENASVVQTVPSGYQVAHPGLQSPNQTVLAPDLLDFHL